MGRIIRKLELAKVGEWGANSDKITTGDLKEAVETFTAGRPVGLGHAVMRRDDAPSYGKVWSVSLTENGNALVGDVEFSEELNKLYESGKYNGWSVSLPKRKKDGKTYFHHLAFLGATPPKIPGLKDLGQVSFNYADGDEVIVYEFSGAIRDFDDDIFNKENSMDPEEIKKMQEELAAMKAELEKLRQEKKELEEKLAGLEGKKDGKEDEPKSEVPKEFADQMNAMKAEMQKNRISAFKAKVSGKVPAGLMGEVEALGTALSASNFADSSVEFADNGKSTKANPLDLLASILSKMPQPVVEGFSGVEFADSVNGDGKNENYASKMMGAM